MATPKKSTRATRSTAQTAQAFEEVSENVSLKRALTPGEQGAIAAKEEGLRNTVTTFNLEKTLQGLTSTGLGLTKAVTAISEDLQKAAQQVTELTEAKDLLIKDIETLHGKEIVASAVEDLIADFRTKKEEIQSSFDAFTKEIAQERQDAAESWGREQAQHDEVIQERNRVAQEARQRAESEYQYKTQQDRARAELAWKNKMDDATRAENLRVEMLQRGWNDREAALQAKERELLALQERVIGIPAEIEAAVKKAEAIVGNAMKRDYTHQIEILTAQQNAEKTVLTSRINSLNDQLVASMTSIASLNQQLAQANEKVSKIATDALSAASGRQALAEVQGMIQNQQNGAGKKQ